MVWEENKHPRDKSGQFTSKGNEGQGGSDKEKDARKELGKKLADAGYDIDKLKSVEETLAEYDDFDNDYDFDKWEEETGYKKEEHVGYIDTNKTYKPDEILDIINSDDDWDVVAGGGFGNNNVWFQHKSGPNYVYDKKTGKLKLLSKNAFENFEGFNDEVNIDEVVSDSEYVYLGIKDKDQFVDILHRRDNVPIDKAKEWVEKNWDEYQKYQDEDKSQPATKEDIATYQSKVEDAIKKYGRIGGALYDELDDHHLYYDFKDKKVKSQVEEEIF